MRDLVSLDFSLCQIAAAEATIDQIDPGSDWTTLRTAPDEALLLGGGKARFDPALESAIAELEPEAVVRDGGDGWSGAALVGTSRFRSFALLSELELDALEHDRRFIQGDVLGLGAKVIVLPGDIAVLWPATFDAYVTACLADLGLAPDSLPRRDWADLVRETSTLGADRSLGSV